jgi:hypothetical protein
VGERDGGAVAQLGERRNRTAEVRGSNPLGSTSLRSLISAEMFRELLGTEGYKPAKPWA